LTRMLVRGVEKSIQLHTRKYYNVLLNR